MDRRKFLTSTVVAPTLALSACGYTAEDEERFLSRCDIARKPPTGPLVVDMHCHLLNALDADYAAFVDRRFLRTGSVLLPRVLQRLRARIDPDTLSARREANELLRRIRDPKASPNQFCREGLPGENDLFVTNDGLEDTPDTRLGDGRFTGFFSSRTRNAAILLAQFQQVDLFVPAVVDFYEGDTLNYPDPDEQIQYYSALAYASKGRFLPMVSFHPERYALERSDMHALTNLDLVRAAIENAGAVGVKVHPSAGFDPLSNVDYAAVTGRVNGADCVKYRDDNRGLHTLMDEGMRRLYELCDELDVPILTHGAPSLAANPDCMMQGNDPNNWTNSTGHWIDAIRKDPEANPRIAFAHLAGGPGSLEELVQSAGADGHSHGSYFAARTGDGYEPSHWLQTALDALKSDRGDIWIDASIQNEIAYSRAVVENKLPDGPRWTSTRSGQELFDEAKEDDGHLVAWFRTLFDDHPALRRRLMYGSDLHMPSVGVVSGGDAYLRLIRNSLPETGDTRERVMGLNAAEFLGLKRGRQTRNRLEHFFSRTGVSLEDVPWIKKVDEAGSRIA